VRVCVFLSEVKAQKLAAQLRDASHAGAIAAAFDRWIGRRLERMLLGDGHGLRVVHAAVRPGPVAPHALADVPAAARRAFEGRLRAQLVTGFVELLRAQTPRLVAATQDAADGITLRFSIEHPPGLRELLQALVERGARAGAIVAAIGKAEPAAVRVEVFPGHRCG
jgi:hypothetical protein